MNSHLSFKKNVRFTKTFKPQIHSVWTSGVPLSFWITCTDLAAAVTHFFNDYYIFAGQDKRFVFFFMLVVIFLA